MVSNEFATTENTEDTENERDLEKGGALRGRDFVRERLGEVKALGRRDFETGRDFEMRRFFLEGRDLGTVRFREGGALRERL